MGTVAQIADGERAVEFYRATLDRVRAERNALRAEARDLRVELRSARAALDSFSAQLAAARKTGNAAELDRVAKSLVEQADLARRCER